MAKKVSPNKITKLFVKMGELVGQFDQRLASIEAQLSILTRSDAKSNGDDALPLAALTVAQFIRAYGISGGRFYEEVKQGRIEIRKCGRRTLVPQSAAERWFNILPDQSGRQHRR